MTTPLLLKIATLLVLLPPYTSRVAYFEPRRMYVYPLYTCLYLFIPVYSSKAILNFVLLHKIFCGFNDFDDFPC